MKLTLTLDDEKWGHALAKEAGDAVAAEANVTAKVNEYLDACGRDVGANVDTEIQKKLATKTDAEKVTLLATL